MSGPAAGGWRAAAIASVAAALVLVALGARTVHRSQTSSEFCTSCHVEVQGRHWSALGHPSVGCQSCHAVSLGTGLRLGVGAAVGNQHPKAHGKMGAATCRGCHGEADARWQRVALTEGHRKHPDGGKTDCLSCHAGETHGRTGKADATCTDCHADARLHKKAAEHGGQCTSCHNFSLPDSKSSPGLIADACGRCHATNVLAGADVVPATPILRSGLHGGVDCKLCHQPHAKDQAPKACKSCHQIQIVASNPHLPKEHIQCESCHVQHKPIESAGSRCVTCHEQAKPKTDGTKSTALRHDQCASCHLPHTWAAAPNECVTCHGKEATLVQTQSPAKHQRCTNCHEVHGKPPSGATCGKCHEQNAKKLLAGPAKHQDCTSCHNPHAPEVKVPTTCAECHKQPLHQMVTLGPAAHAKASCEACHTVHGNPKADTKTCATCHKDKNQLVAKATKVEHQACQSCHAPHKFSVDKQSPPCAKCHAQIANATGAPHGGKCVGCHAPHGSPLVAKDKCLGCHTKVQLKPPPGNVQHATCASCHKPHTLAKLAVDRCTGCHADKATIAQSWPLGSAHRDACNKCHTPHDVREKAACGTCHEKQQASLAGGKHECRSCHAVHKTPPTEKKGWWGQCANCHATQVKEVASSKKHDRCSSCHQPHKFQKPDCKSCHATAAGQGLHAKKGHADCGKCHQTHTASIPTRNECFACHTDKTAHNPEMKVCTACHLFKL